MTEIFISYRRDDSAGAAGRLYDRLAAHFGKEQVFRDLDAIPPGAEFAELIGERIARCRVLIAVIGKAWLDAATAEGQRRLDDPKDLVRTEIREALRQGKLVIPALIDGASVPRANQLPDDIAALAARNALEISDSRYDFDTGRVIDAVVKAGVVSKSRDEAQSPAHPSLTGGVPAKGKNRAWIYLGSGVAAVVAGVLLTVLALRTAPPTQRDPVNTAILEIANAIDGDFQSIRGDREAPDPEFPNTATYEATITIPGSIYNYIDIEEGDLPYFIASLYYGPDKRVAADKYYDFVSLLRQLFPDWLEHNQILDEETPFTDYTTFVKGERKIIVNLDRDDGDQGVFHVMITFKKPDSSLEDRGHSQVEPPVDHGGSTER